MPFQLPPTGFQKELSTTTQKIYQAKLNKLAAAGFDTPELLASKKAAVVKAIKEAAGEEDTAAARHTRRLFLSAIFAVIPPQASKRSPYYQLYQKSLPAVEGWVRKTKYEPDA
jgi:hypothetical protein